MDEFTICVCGLRQEYGAKVFRLCFLPWLRTEIRLEMIEMDEKKVSEAIDFIKTLITAGNDDERLYTAIEALQKQLPKKPKNWEMEI